MIQYGT